MGRRLDDEQRLRLLRATRLLDSPTEADFDEMTQGAARILRVPGSMVSLIDRDRQFLKSAVGLREPWASKRETPLSHSFCRHTVEDQQPFIVSDARLHPRVRDNPAVADGVVAYAGVPLMVEGEALGAFCVVDDEVRAWTDEELDTLTLFGKYVERLIALRIANDTLMRKSALLDAVVESIDEALVACDRDGEVLLWNRAASELLGEHSRTPTGEWPERFGLYADDRVTPCTPDDVPLSRALSGQTVSQRLLFVRSPHRPEGRWHSVSASPLRSATGELWGAVSVGRDITAMKQLQEQLHEASVRDPLTGLHNRRGFELLAAQAMKTAQRAGHRLALFFLDLNGMKTINDNLGHEQGDRALTATAHIMRRTFRDSDVLARLGGDEFVALAAAVPDDVDQLLRGRLEQNIAAHAAEAQEPFRLSISIGVAYYDPRAPTTVERLLAEADKRMYVSKSMSPDSRRGSEPSARGRRHEP